MPPREGRISSKEDVSFSADRISPSNRTRHKKSRSYMCFLGFLRPREWQLGMYTVTTRPMICQRWVRAGFRACAECVTALPHHFSILLFHVLFCLADSSNDRLSGLCKHGVQTECDAAAALLLAIYSQSSLPAKVNVFSFLFLVSLKATFGLHISCCTPLHH